jgi:hypothetical protein
MPKVPCIVGLAMPINLLDYRKAMEGLTVSIEEFEASTSGSNAGAACAIAKLEHCFLFFLAVLLLIVGYYVPIENRAIPSLAVAACCALAAQAEFAISSNTFDIQIYQGSFTELLGQVAYLNVFFGSLHALVSAGYFIGFAKSPATTNGSSVNKKD